MTALPITHFSDVLCVWAYVGHRRMLEVGVEFGDRVAIDYRFVSVFGAGRSKQEARWRDKGGLAGYANHVRGVVARFDHVTVHADTWARVAPASSTPAHVVLAAVRALEAAGTFAVGAFADATWRVREALFRDARDVSRTEIVLDIAREAGLDVEAIRGELASGAAFAELARDVDQTRELEVRMSPTIVMNEARQQLVGNVGYRVIAANLRELLDAPRASQASWC